MQRKAKRGKVTDRLGEKESYELVLVGSSRTHHHAFVLRFRAQITVSRPPLLIPSLSLPDRNVADVSVPKSHSEILKRIFFI